MMDVKIPRLGEGADTGTVASIFVKVGDQINKDDAVIELESEKAVASIPSPASGKVTKILVKQGDTVKVGQSILTLESADTPAQAAPQPAPVPAKPTPAPAPAAAATPAMPATPLAPLSEPTGPMPAAAPSVRKVARELGIDLRRVQGSERGGRVSMSDLRAYVQNLERLALQPSAPNLGATPSAPEPIDFSQWGEIARKPMSQLRRVIARRMHESWSQVPHVTQFDDADLSHINALRTKYANAYEVKGARLTFTPILLKALVETLKKHPLLNASLDEQANEIVIKEYYNLGIAVDTEQGLIVPVLRDADKKTILEIATDLEELARKTRERKVSADDMKGGTFTVSNQGGIGGSHFTPIINRPDVAILGLGRAAMKAVVRDKKIEPRLMLPLCLSYDHRVLDGGNAARFVVDLVKTIESVDESLLKL
jgi:pyruvate dehydrogenase E2 component (dihydrolipoamide acetyltransferase)